MPLTRGLVICLSVLLLCLAGQALAADKVLVVFSYEEDFPWDVEIREGIEATFKGQAELHYYYMDTKVNLATGAQKAAGAFALYQALQPAGVIAADDNAQAMFVVPYLRDKVETPVIFCGVNAAPERYGYPSRNVTGILERFHLEETIAFSRQFSPQIKTFAFLIKQGPVAELIQKQLAADAGNLSAELVAFHPVSRSAEALAVAAGLRGKADLLLIESLQGVVDDRGRTIPEKRLVAQVVDVFAGPTAATNAYTVRYGALNAVIKSGREQGSVAAQMLRKAMQGTPVAELPVTRNYQGKRMLNLGSMQKLGISPPAMALRGAELVFTEKSN